MDKPGISPRALLSLLTATLAGRLLQITPGRCAALAGKGAWLSPLFALPAVLAWGALAREILREEDLGEYAVRVLGRHAGRGVCLLYALWAWLLLFVSLHTAADRLLSTGYGNRPRALLLAAVAGVILWTARGSFAAAVRGGEIFRLILVGAAGIIVLLAVPGMRPERAFPLSAGEAAGAAAGAVSVLGILGHCVFAAFFAGEVRRGEGYAARARRRCCELCLGLAGAILVCLGAFGPELLARLETPFFMLARTVGSERGFARIESAAAALGVFSDLALGVLLAFAVSELCARCLGGRRESWAIPAVLAAALAALVLFPEKGGIDIFIDRVVLPGNLAFGFALPTLLWGIARAKNGHKKADVVVRKRAKMQDVVGLKNGRKKLHFPRKKC